MLKAAKALLNEPLGGRRDMLSMSLAAVGFVSCFPPFAQMIQYAEPWMRSSLRTALMTLGFYGAYRLTYEVLKSERRKFTLPHTGMVESSDVSAQKKSGLLFGYTTDDGTPLIIWDEDLVRHGLIIGQTGKGKSVLGKTMMFQQIERGGGLLFCDGKLDVDNIQEIYEFAVYCGRGHDFLVINPGQPETSNSYNPILYGDPDEVASRILSLIPSQGISAEADHYKQSANLALVCFISALQESSPEEVKSYLQEACRKSSSDMDEAMTSHVKGVAYNFLDLALLTMNEGVLTRLLIQVQKKSPDSMARKNLSIFLEQYAYEGNKRGSSQDMPEGTLQIDLQQLKKTLGGIGSRMHQFGSGKFGQVLNSYSPDVKLYEAIRDGKIVYAALPTMGKDVAAQNLGKMLIADLRTAISWLQLNKNDRPKIPFLAFMDEMSSYSTDSLAVMFEQARSAQVALFPAIQTDSGLTNVSEDFKERIMANTELKIFFKLSSQETADAASEVIGMTRRLQSSETNTEGVSASAQALNVGPNKSISDSSSSGRGEREAEEPLVHPDVIKALDTGECIVLRSPNVWNIRVPMLALDPKIRQCIGRVRVNHFKGNLSKDQKFDAVSKVDEFIKESQRRRIGKSGGKGLRHEAMTAQAAMPGGFDAFESMDSLPTD